MTLVRATSIDSQSEYSYMYKALYYLPDCAGSSISAYSLRHMSLRRPRSGLSDSEHSAGSASRSPRWPPMCRRGASATHSALPSRLSHSLPALHTSPPSSVVPAKPRTRMRLLMSERQDVTSAFVVSLTHTHTITMLCTNKRVHKEMKGGGTSRRSSSSQCLA